MVSEFSYFGLSGGTTAVGFLASFHRSSVTGCYSPVQSKFSFICYIDDTHSLFSNNIPYTIIISILFPLSSVDHPPDHAYHCSHPWIHNKLKFLRSTLVIHLFMGCSHMLHLSPSPGIWYILHGSIIPVITDMNWVFLQAGELEGRVRAWNPVISSSWILQQPGRLHSFGWPIICINLDRVMSYPGRQR